MCIRDRYYGYKLMIIEYLDENGEPDGNRLIAFDAGQAGVGDTVLVLSLIHIFYPVPENSA